jgi:hypothetical protein
MTYGRVLPNLECAKLCAYYKNKKQITVLAPTLEPERYTEFHIRKEYDDGEFSQALFKPNVVYGGRAFSDGKYIPLDDRIERTRPDMSIYEKYSKLYGTTKTAEAEIKKILRSAHVRLSQDGKNVDSRAINYCLNNYPQTSGGIILHDYYPGRIEGLYDIVYELSNTRYSKNGNSKPLPIGNKYPIDIYDQNELLKWANIYPMEGILFFRFYGLIDDEVLNELINKNRQFCRQIYCMVDYGCSSENDFLMNRAIKIFKQILFYRMTNTKILLKYTDGFFKTKELEFLISLWNCFGNQKWNDNMGAYAQSLYRYCASPGHKLYKDILFRNNYVNQYEMREAFQYVRVHNYELFKMFYEWNKVVFKGGEIRNAFE